MLLANATYYHCIGLYTIAYANVIYSSLMLTLYIAAKGNANRIYCSYCYMVMQYTVAYATC